MTVTAMLSWYDEPAALLRQAVKGAAVICDRIVCADGGYWFVPDKRASSPPAQKRAICNEAYKHGLKVEFLEPRIYAGQVEKRDAVLQVAKERSDWVMVLDADWRITGERDAIRAELENFWKTGYEQICVNFVTPDDPSRSWDAKAANEWHVRMAGNFEQLPFIYRTIPEMHYTKNHWSIAGRTAEGRPVGLFGLSNFGNWGMAKTGWLQANHLFEHLCLFRQSKQVLRNREYIRLRDQDVERVGYET